MASNYYTVTEFRSNIYSMIDVMLKTGEPLLLRRDNKIIEVREKANQSKKSKSKEKRRDLSKITPLDCMTEPPEWYISPKLYEWSGEIDPNIR